MEMNIGANIKRFRLAKGLTQEQLAGLLSVSTAAVSKWEMQNSYPDITLLFPLAHLFGVSVDELMGYDEARAKEEVETIIKEYHTLGVRGDFAAREKLIRKARKKYPQSFRIMNLYMWELAGGSADNDPATLLEHKDELAQMCDIILESCTVDDLRASAITLKAKLLHAENKTSEAIDLLSALPAWHAPMVTEQLFAKNTSEYRYWNKRNCIGLLDVFANRFARVIRYDPNLTLEEKTARLENAAQKFAELQIKPSMEVFCIAEQMVLAETGTMLTIGESDINNIVRIRKKQFASMQKIMHFAESDEVVAERIKSQYKTDKLTEWLVDFLLNSPLPRLAKLRDYPEYTQMLKELKENC